MADLLSWSGIIIASLGLLVAVLAWGWLAIQARDDDDQPPMFV